MWKLSKETNCVNNEQLFWLRISVPPPPDLHSCADDHPAHHQPRVVQLANMISASGLRIWQQSACSMESVHGSVETLDQVHPKSNCLFQIKRVAILQRAMFGYFVWTWDFIWDLDVWRGGNRWPIIDQNTLCFLILTSRSLLGIWLRKIGYGNVIASVLLVLRMKKTNIWAFSENFKITIIRANEFA